MKSNPTEHQGEKKLTPIYAFLLRIAGLLSVGLAIAGIFLPLLPTTPFLLLASLCFLKSSPRLYRWLTTHKLFGSYINNYLKHKAIPLSTKLTSLVLLWGTILSTILFAVQLIWLRITLLIIAAGVTIHITRMKTLTKAMKKNLEEPPSDRDL